MATRIYITDKHEVRILSCISDGQEFMADVLGGNNDGSYDTTRSDAEYEMCEEHYQWWEEWAYREQRILDRANELGEEAIEGISRLGTEYDDLDALHDAQERFLGICQ